MTEDKIPTLEILVEQGCYTAFATADCWRDALSHSGVEAINEEITSFLLGQQEERKPA